MKIKDIEFILKKYKDYNNFSGYPEYDDGFDAGVLSVITDLENLSEINIIHCQECIYCWKNGWSSRDGDTYACKLKNNTRVYLEEFCSRGKLDEN